MPTADSDSIMRKEVETMETSSRPIEYYLEVYEPGSMDTVFISWKSDSPFIAISRGDIVHLPMVEGSESPMYVLKAINVEHILWDTADKIGHKLCVYTERVEGTRELRVEQV
jgi:hypothetical protein